MLPQAQLAGGAAGGADQCHTRCAHPDGQVPVPARQRFALEHQHQRARRLSLGHAGWVAAGANGGHGSIDARHQCICASDAPFTSIHNFTSTHYARRAAIQLRFQQGTSRWTSPVVALSSPASSAACLIANTWWTQCTNVGVVYTGAPGTTSGVMTLAVSSAVVSAHAAGRVYSSPPEPT
jgi:hypothetical protein